MSTNIHKGSKLSSDEQLQILTLDQVGKSSREIAHIIRRSKNVILKFLKSSEKYKNAKKKEKKSKMTPQATKRLILQTSRSTMSADQLRKDQHVVFNKFWALQNSCSMAWQNVFREPAFGTAKLELRGVKKNWKFTRIGQKSFLVIRKASLGIILLGVSISRRIPGAHQSCPQNDNPGGFFNGVGRHKCQR